MVVVSFRQQPSGLDGSARGFSETKSMKGWPCLEHICERKEKTLKECLKHNKPYASNGLRPHVIRSVRLMGN